MPQLPEPGWGPRSPGSSSTAQLQCVTCRDIPALSPPGLRILVPAGKLIQPSGPVLGHHISSGQGVPRTGQMPGQQAPTHFSPGPEHHGLQRHPGPAAPPRWSYVQGPACGHVRQDCLGDTLAPMAAGSQEQGLVLAWTELGVVLGRGQDRAGRGVGLAPTPVHAEGALRPWGMEVWVPTSVKVT